MSLSLIFAKHVLLKEEDQGHLDKGPIKRMRKEIEGHVQGMIIDLRKIRNPTEVEKNPVQIKILEKIMERIKLQLLSEANSLGRFDQASPR